MSAAGAVAWVTAADLDGHRHLAGRSGAGWVAVCGAAFGQRDTRRVIPRRCPGCAAGAGRPGLVVVESPDLAGADAP